MPFILRSKIDKMAENEPFPGKRSRRLVGKDNGSVALTVTDSNIEPDSKVGLHIHPNFEEAVLIMEGSIEGVIGDEVRTLAPGDVMLVPAGTKHAVNNRTNEAARVIHIIPTNAPVRFPA